MPKNKFLWNFLPSVTVLSDKFNSRYRGTHYSAFGLLLHKRYFSQQQVGNFINTSIFQTIRSKSGGAPSLEKLKAVNYFSRLAAGASFLKSYVASNPSGHLVSIGGGPRGVMQFNAEVDFLQEHSDDFEELMKAGSVYNMQTTIIEKQGIAALSGGVAWTALFGAGEMNTGAEQGKEARLIKYVTENKEAIEQEFLLNPVAYAILKRAYRAKHIFESPLNRALLTRRVVGRELRRHFDQQVKKADEIALGYTLNVICDTAVKGIDVSNPLQPIVLAENKDGILGISADNVRMNIGTVTHCATEDREVQKLTYWGPMFSASGTKDDPDDVQGVTAFLKQQSLTDENNKLKKDSTLLVGGSGLSLYDQIMTLQDSMGLFETVPEEEWDAYPLGYRVSPKAIEKYVTNRSDKDIPPIVVVSRTPGKWIPPRHSHGPWWSQTLPGEQTSSQPLAGSAKIQHALFLHGDGGHVFDYWKTIADGAIAAYCGLHPDDLDKDPDTYTLLKDQYARSIERARKINNYSDDPSSSRTLEGASREAYLAAILGFGMEKGPGPVLLDPQSLVNIAPLTTRGRLGYLIHRAQFRAISNPVTYKPTRAHAAEQRVMLANAGEIMNHVTASPIEVHSLMQMLIDAGIAAYIPIDYADIKNTENKLTIDPAAIDKVQKTPYLDRIGGADKLKAAKFDAFIVSAIFYGKPDVIPIADANLSDSRTVDTSAVKKALTFEDMQAVYEEKESDETPVSEESRALVKSIDSQLAVKSANLTKQLANIEQQKDSIFNIYIPDSGYSVKPNRRLAMMIKGKPVTTSIELNALLGKGVTLSDAVKYVGDPKTDSELAALRMKSDIFATDVNNRESITDLVKPQAYYRFALEHMRAAGIENPQEELDRFYYLQNMTTHSLVDTMVPGGTITVTNIDQEYNEEVKQFEPYYNVGRLAAAYISAISELTAGDAGKYVTLYSAGRGIFEGTSLNFDNFAQKIKAEKSLQADGDKIIEKMKTALGDSYAFAPRKAEDYFAAFVDYPEHIHKMAYQWAVKSAKAQLQKNKPAEFYEILDPSTALDMIVEYY